MEIWERHNELFHYTDLRGAQGILTSGQIWATHFKNLNDRTETRVALEEVPKRVYPHLLAKMMEVQQSVSGSAKRRLAEAGGPFVVSMKESIKIADIFHKTSFRNTPRSRALGEPYIASFCAHTEDQEYEQRNGLLSQWRSYGECNYALVFDTRELTEMLKHEGRAYCYSTAHIGDVVYQHDQEAFDEEFSETIDGLLAAFDAYLENDEWDVRPIAVEMVSLFTRLKHRGFYEEREVRIVACPITRKMIRQFQREDPELAIPKIPLKQQKVSPSGKRYIELLGETSNALPIKRIIVGPGERQHELVAALQDLPATGNLDIHRSETPYI